MISVHNKRDKLPHPVWPELQWHNSHNKVCWLNRIDQNCKLLCMLNLCQLSMNNLWLYCVINLTFAKTRTQTHTKARFLYLKKKWKKLHIASVFSASNYLALLLQVVYSSEVTKSYVKITVIDIKQADKL